VRVCAERGRHWRGMLVPFGIDNTAFQLSADRGRSRAERLNALLRILFALQLQEGFILQTYWLSTHANYLSDDLSRNREDAFLARVLYKIRSSKCTGHGCRPIRNGSYTTLSKNG